MGLKFLVLAPYFYNGSVVELFFSKFKAGDINEDRLKLGKR